MNVELCTNDCQFEKTWQEDAKKLQDAYLFKKRSTHYQNAITYYNEVTKIRDILSLHCTNAAIIFLAHHDIKQLSMPWLLARAAREGYIAFCVFLLNTPKLMPLDTIDTSHALHNAVASGHLKIAALLLERGANAAKKDATGKSPLDYACLNRDPHAIALLVNHIHTLDMDSALFSLLKGSEALGAPTPYNRQLVRTCANLLTQKGGWFNFFGSLKNHKLFWIDYMLHDDRTTSYLFDIGFSLEARDPATQKTVMHYIAPKVNEVGPSKHIAFLLKEQQYKNEVAIALTILGIHKHRKNDAPSFGRIPKDVVTHHILPLVMPLKNKNLAEYRPILLAMLKAILSAKDNQNKMPADYLPKKSLPSARQLFDPERVMLSDLGMQ